MGHTPRVPIDLYRRITENLDDISDRQTLLSLSLSSWPFRHEALRILVRRVVFSASDMMENTRHVRPQRSAIDQSMGFLSLFTKYDNLAKCVLSYEQVGLHYTIDEGASEALPEAMPKHHEHVQLLIRVLFMMINLKRLRLDIVYLRVVHMNTLAYSQIFQILSRCTFRLTHLAFAAERYRDLPVGLFQSQAELEHLDMDVNQQYRYLDARPKLDGLLENLTSLRTKQSEDLLWMAEARKITALCLNQCDWIGIPHLSHPQRAAFVAAWKSLRFLRLKGARQAKDLVEGLITGGLNVEVLEISESSTDAVRTAAKVLKHTRILVLRGLDTSARADLCEYIAETAFTVYPRLQLVVIPHRSSSLGGFSYKPKYGHVDIAEIKIERGVGVVGADWWVRYADM